MLTLFREVKQGRKILAVRQFGTLDSQFVKELVNQRLWGAVIFSL